VQQRLRDALEAAEAVLLSDYGRGCIAAVIDAVRELWPASSLPLAVAPDATPLVPVVWDPHPASGRPPTAITLATPNLREARAAVGATADVDLHDLARTVAARWRCGVAVTCGAEGAVVALPDASDTSDSSAAGEVRRVPTTPADGDACGAGDWFAAGTTVDLARSGRAHAPRSMTDVAAAVAAGCDAAATWVRAGATLRREPTATAHRPTVVATSGCFDVLHVGHLSMLRHARSLGDRLVVLVNSDESVRRLKGHGRPVNGQDDRAALLAGLACVDEVRVFDELTPCEALAAVRPDVFVKGADYAGRRLPEEDVLREWGGRVALAPLVSGRSTTRVLRVAGELGRRAG
jgi:rfaE bifunctional protein nucleotidyltransferase chain/domain